MLIETKMFEIRDSGTLICAIALRVDLFAKNPLPSLPNPERTAYASFEAERWMFLRSGYDPAYAPIFLTKINGGEPIEAHFDPYSWKSQRTMPEAHRYIEKHWSKLASGDVIDVQFILGERPTKKTSERLSA